MELRTARRIANLTQLELATRAGVDDSFISLLESGKRDIQTTDYATVVRIARALHVTPDELFPVEAADIPADVTPSEGTTPSDTPVRDLPSHAPASFTFKGPWFTAAEARAYVCCKTMAAWYVWRNRHGIVPRSNGSVAKADLDHALKFRRKRRIAKATLNNLRHAHRAESGVTLAAEPHSDK
jgi:transcriptional regulator with XRE-family HTH domain